MLSKKERQAAARRVATCRGLLNLAPEAATFEGAQAIIRHLDECDRCRQAVATERARANVDAVIGDVEDAIFGRPS